MKLGEKKRMLADVRSRLASGELVPVSALPPRMPNGDGCFAGVYLIQNTDNGRIYIGSSNNLKQRCGIHRNQLIRNKHRNAFLQRSWNCHGPSAFKFYIVEEVSIPNLIEREQYYIELFEIDDNTYNLCQRAKPCMGRPMTPDERIRHRQRLIDNPPVSVPVCQLSMAGDLINTWANATVAERGVGLGRGTLQACCAGRSKSAGGYQWCYARDINSRVGKPCVRRSTGTEPKPVIQYTLQGEYVKTWKNARTAQRIGGYSCNGVLLCCKGKYNNAGGFQWRFENDSRPVVSQVGSRIIGIRICQIADDGTLIQIWDKQSDAANGVNIDASRISIACRSEGNRKAAGFFWCYEHALPNFQIRRAG